MISNSGHMLCMLRWIKDKQDLNCLVNKLSLSFEIESLELVVVSTDNGPGFNSRSPQRNNDNRTNDAIIMMVNVNITYDRSVTYKIVILLDLLLNLPILALYSDIEIFIM